MAGILLMVGYALCFIGWIWMIVTAIQTGKDTSEKAIWGVVTFICGIVGGIIFFVVRKEGRNPLLIQVAGWVLVIVAMVVGGGSASFGYGQ